MARPRLLWRILPAYVIVVAVALSALAWVAASDISNFFFERKVLDLETMARLAASRIPSQGLSTDRLPASGKDQWCRMSGGAPGFRITVVGADGTVLCDTLEDPASMEGYGDRIEIWEALNGRVGTAVQFNHILEQRLLYVSVPLEADGSGALRIGAPASTVQEVLWGLRKRFLAGVLMVLLSVSLVSLLVVSYVVTPLKHMKKGAERFARGDFSSSLPIPRTEEFASLAEEMNRMASHLDDRIRTVINQRNELEAVLSSMVEGVLAVDTQERLISFNQAAVDLLGLVPGEAQNRIIHEVVRNSDLQTFVGKTLGNDDPVEGQIPLLDEQGERFLQVHGTPLKDTTGSKIGALVVLNDVTRLRRLENIRREFVANASHEIRTPITSIKGFVETLLDGALDDRETAERFLGIIKKHSDRLDAIVQDLLNLSRIEKEAERGEIHLEKGRLCEVVDEAVEACQARAENRSISIKVDCPPDLKGRFSPSLLIQAMINLIDNAVKYSEPGGTVMVRCSGNESELRMSVKDRGPGIARKHIPRLFERFYRVDKARSRTLGGTGLGLAIVKHIAQVHSGEVTVESEPGQGSTFTIILPS